jgi:hypothetical protein
LLYVLANPVDDTKSESKLAPHFSGKGREKVISCRYNNKPKAGRLPFLREKRMGLLLLDFLAFY